MNLSSTHHALKRQSIGQVIWVVLQLTEPFLQDLSSMETITECKLLSFNSATLRLSNTWRECSQVTWVPSLATTARIMVGQPSIMWGSPAETCSWELPQFQKKVNLKLKAIPRFSIPPWWWLGQVSYLTAPRCLCMLSRLLSGTAQSGDNSQR